MVFKKTYGILFVLMLSLLPHTAYALAFGIGLGSIKITPEGTSNLESINPDINAKITTAPLSYNLQVHGGITDYLFFEAGLAVLSHIEKEQKENNIPAPAKISAFKISSREEYTALYGALGLAIFLSDQFAIYGKAGGNINSTTYSVKQVVNYQNSNFDTQEDRATDTNLDPYLAVGLLYNLTESFLIKFDIEDFGVIGNDAEISGDFFLPNTADNPEASGSRVQRAILHFLFRL